MQCLATFETTHMALKFEKSCAKAGIEVRIVPVPRELSSSCGFACKFPCDERAAVERIAAEKNIEVASYHEIEGDR